MEDGSVSPPPVKRERLDSEVVADHQRVCVIQRPKQRIELMSDDEQNSAYYCRRGPVLSENSINNILKVVSLQSFSSSRAQQSNNEVSNHRSELGSDSPISSTRSSGESSPSSEDSHSQFIPVAENERNASRKASSRRRGEKVASSMKDDKYWEKRLRNNASAKRSRDARRVRELECQIRSEFMEEENRKLEEENKMLREENERLSKLIQELKPKA